MTNNEKFNQMINECENPRLVLNAMLALAPMIREARAQRQNETTERNSAAQHMDGREMFHQMLNSRRNPEKAYELLSAIAKGGN